MNDTTIISIEDIKTVTSISDNMDVELLKPFLFNAQEMYIRPILGDALFTDVISVVESGSSKYDTLINDYILYGLSYATWFTSAPFLHMKTQKKGIVLQNSDNSQNVSVEEWTIYAKRIENTMTFYLNRLKSYLDDNKTSYDLYACETSDTKSSSSSIFLGF